MKIKDLSWAEKYRVNTVKDVISVHTDKIVKYLKDSNSVPNFLFTSKTPGTGKTTMAYAIINDLDCDKLILNSSDDRTLDVVRNKIKDYVRCKSSKDGRRCVFLDEFDGFPKLSQEALRNMMETYAHNAFFILTCNNNEKVIDPIKSRCIELEFSRPAKATISSFLNEIMVDEQLNFSIDGLNKLIDMKYPSIRNMVNTLQDLKIDGKDVTVENIIGRDDEFKMIWGLILDKKYSEVKRLLIENAVNVEEFNKFIFRLCIDDLVEVKKQLKLLQVLSKNEVAFGTTADKMIVFLASVVEMIVVMKE